MVLLTGRTLLAGIVATAASATVLVASPASAATTSTGVRCTIVGTSGADVLKGTSRRDVICGRGGSDVIYARGGNDLVDGGGGNDRIYGSYGADKLLGGTGRDTIRGEAGADVIYGGSSSDSLYGGTSDDTIRGGSGSDQIQGDDGHDHLYGEAYRDTVNGGTGWDLLYGGTGGDRILGGKGNDRAYGGDGADGLYGGAGDDQLHGGNHNDLVLGEADADRLWGDAGADQIRGGSGADQLAGGDGNDQLEGESHDDALKGGAGTDHLTGGTGMNRCTYDTYDYLLGGCGTDKSAPKVLSVSFSPSSIDTTKADVKVRVRVRVTDDIGVTWVQGHVVDERDNVGTSLYMQHLTWVSGGPRDGWWEYDLTVPRHTPAANLHANIYAEDAAERMSSGYDMGTLAVTNNNPDDQSPTLSLTKFTPTSVDVTTAARTVEVAVRGVDPMAGVSRVDLCLVRATVLSATDPTPLVDTVVCTDAVPRAAGSAKDGTWSAKLVIPKGSPSGVYNAYAYAEDRIGNYVYYMGPEAHNAYADGGWSGGESRRLFAAPSRVQVTGS
ncbi:calcium-binding protein [Nocardioides sp. NPDC047086]|uniref:calcium-binding protein n=1 Tax=Nocardioides sp. NPDC047086 TaxID=3154810 RepID=UPI00340A7C6B